MTNPWTSACEVTLTFTSDGHYSAHSPGELCIAMYYGVNDDSPQKTYSLDDVMTNGEAAGTIQFFFGASGTNAGELKGVVLGSGDNALSFLAWKDKYGPMVYSLHRL